MDHGDLVRDIRLQKLRDAIANLKGPPALSAHMVDLGKRILGIDEGEESQRPDTLQRIRLTGPAARVIHADMKRLNPADALEDLYNPDAVTRQFDLPAHRVLAHASVPIGSEYDPPMPHRLQLVEPGPGGAVKLREVSVRTAAQLKDLCESAAYRRSRLAESTGEFNADVQAFDALVQKPLREARALCLEETADLRGEQQEQAVRLLREGGVDHFARGDDVGDRSLTQDMDTETVPIMGGPYFKQLYLYAHWEQTARCFHEKNSSELARTAIETTSDFVLGRGLQWKIKHPKVRAIWEEFWRRNNMEVRLRTLCDDLTWQGELLIHKTESVAGFLKVRSIDPSTIYEIVTNPTDVEEVYYYHQQYPTQYQIPFGAGNARFNLQVPTQKYVINQIPPSEIFHVKNNVTAAEKWGRSDFFSSLPTLRRHRDWLNATTLRDVLQANFVWRVTVNGDQSDVEAFLADENNTRMPPFGSMWVQNQQVNLEPIHTQMMTGMMSGSTGDVLVALFAAGQQMPTSYFNQSSGGAARATALVQGEPFAKKISTRQQTIQRIIDHLFEAQMQLAVRTGRLSAAEIRGDEADPEWMFPATYDEDRGAKIRDISAGFMQKSISHRTASTMLASELGLDEYDYDQESLEIDQEAERMQLLGLAAPPPQDPSMMGGDPSMMGSDPGMEGAAGGMPSAPGQAPTLPPEMLQLLAGEEAARHENIAGADERHRFRQRQRDVVESQPGPTRVNLTTEDRRLLESAVAEGRTGRIRLPSGRLAVIPPQT